MWDCRLLYVEGVDLKLRLPYLNRKLFWGAIGVAESVRGGVARASIPTFSLEKFAYYLHKEYLRINYLCVPPFHRRKTGEVPPFHRKDKERSPPFSPWKTL